MQDTVYLPLQANRFTALSATLVFNNLNLTGRVLKAQVRPTQNDTGTPLADLTAQVNPIVNGVRLIAVNALGPVPISYVGIFITKATLLAMPAAAGVTGTALTDDVDLIYSWDLVATDAQGVDDVLAYGPLVLRAGVTR